jgi:hypothetical protein
MERTRGFKFAWLAFMLLQLGLPSWSVIADARTLGPLPLGDVHVEANGCHPSHPLDCRLCSFARAAADLTSRMPELPLPVATVSAPFSTLSTRPALAASRSPLPRAPPLDS